MNNNLHFKIAQNLSNLLDEKFSILGFKFGLDPILGLFYGVGDVISFLLSLYIVWIAVQMKLPEDKLAKMIANLVFDFLLGLIPVLGQASDFVFKANSMNIKILHEHLKNRDNIVEGKTVR